MTGPRTITSAPRRGRSAAAARAVRRLDADLAAWERAEQMRVAAEALAATDPRGAFEMVHRAALKGAGVLVEQANRERRRRLPLNVWEALARVDGEGASRAQQVQAMVAERARLDRDPTATPDPSLLRSHLEQTGRHLLLVRSRVTEEVLGGDLPMAG